MNCLTVDCACLKAGNGHGLYDLIHLNEKGCAADECYDG